MCDENTVRKLKPTPHNITNKEKKYEKLKYELKIRKQALELTVLYEKEILEKLGVRKLTEMRDRILDRINCINTLLKSIEKDLNN